MAIRIPLVQTADRLINQVQQNIRNAVEPVLNGLVGWVGKTDGAPVTSPAIGYATDISSSFALTANATAAGALHTIAAGVWLVTITSNFSLANTVVAPITSLYLNGATGGVLGQDLCSDQQTHAGGNNFPGPSFALYTNQAGPFTLQLKTACGANVSTASLLYHLLAVRCG